MLAVLGFTTFLVFLDSTIKNIPENYHDTSLRENECTTTETGDKEFSYIKVWEDCLLNKGLKDIVSQNTTGILCDPGRLFLLYISCSIKQENSDTWEGCLSANSLFLSGGSDELDIPIPGITKLSFEKEQEAVVCLIDRGSDDVFSTCSIDKTFSYWLENVYLNCPPGHVICPETKSCLTAKRRQECTGSIVGQYWLVSSSDGVQTFEGFAVHEFWRNMSAEDDPELMVMAIDERLGKWWYR
ncbi:uncharacterized protein LOC111083614, partial [Limulus polyphemus]|uniref:Uncharacterized protein LOC111083614 n=1 Tax=Limulus polyphemus TaxID=6850 RepID=A0ABM1RX45_LIMPO